MAKKKKEESKPENRIPDQASFASLILMLATGALQQMGVVENPITEKKEKNMPMAKLTIDTLGVLKEKTKGNLEKEEEQLLDGLLYDLKLKYVKETGQ
jgi:hypothetical protein